ncbi:MAG TPA: TylF/MycF/NovP-related O-methyltransferase [Geobacteraceae bacterium]
MTERTLNLKMKKTLRRLATSYTDLVAIVGFVAGDFPRLSPAGRLALVKRLFDISGKVECPHSHSEVLSYIRTILALPGNGGRVVEAGCFKGGSTAKFSLATGIAGKELVVFDSFQGIPEHSEPHDRNIYGIPVSFAQGEYCGGLDEVMNNVKTYGNINSCRFVKGWFEETLPGFAEPVDAVYIDVDLASSVKTCLKYLYPLLKPGGAFFTHDGHLPLVIEVLKNDKFWREEVGCSKPPMEGLGTSKLVKIMKLETSVN